MHRIDTSTKAANLFGTGKHGYTLGNPPPADPVVPATATSADQFNAVQEELARPIELSGRTLEKPNNSQLAASLRDYYEANWDVQETDVSNDIRAVFFQPGKRWLAVMDDGNVLRSLDGYAWTRPTIIYSDKYGPATVAASVVTPDSTPSPAWTTNQYAGKYFIDSDGDRFFITANDATTLTVDGTPHAGSNSFWAIVQAHPVGAALNDVVGAVPSSANELLAVGEGGRVFRSLDNGATWTTAATVLADEFTVGKGDVAGSVFTPEFSATWTLNQFVGKYFVDRDGAMFIIVANDADTLTVTGSPASGTNHTWQVVTPVTTKLLRAALISPNAGAFAVGENKALYYSADRATWAALTIPTLVDAFAKNIVALAHNYPGSGLVTDAHHILMVNQASSGGADGFLLGPITTDTTLFLSHLAFLSAPSGFIPASVTWSGLLQKWVCVGDVTGKVYTADHDLSAGWTLQATLGARLTKVVCGNGGLLLASGPNGVVFTSVDGVTWKQRVVSTTSDILTAAWGGTGFWVVAGESGALATCFRL
jgi:hypothetical protein